MAHEIIEEEGALLSRVQTLLEEEPYIAPPSEKDLVADLVKLRDEIRQAKTDDRGSMMEQYNHQIALLEQLRATRDKPEVDPACPYFAHLRLEEGGKTRDLCLGKATRIQRGVRIVDWRNAPVSSVFYRYRQGEEYEEVFGDRSVEGVVQARRTLSIRRGSLDRIDAPEGIFTQVDERWVRSEREAARMVGGQGATAQVYSAGQGAERRLGTDRRGTWRKADKHLPDIAGLIDTEQFELITQPTSGFVVIRGTAGSGKTTVALHRIAWMAFEDPQINSPKTLFLVFSKALRDYVSHVLPALGVPKVSVRAFGEWSRAQVLRHYPMLPQAIRDNTPSMVVRLKVHPLMLEVLRRQVEAVDVKPSPEAALDDMMSALTNLDLLREVFERRGVFTRDELHQVVQWSRDRNDEWVAYLEGDRRSGAELDAEDDSLLLRAWQLRMGPLRAKGRRPLVYRHLAIDEVQDFSPLDVQIVIDCLDKRKSITLAGDTQQHVMEDAGFTSWTAFFEHLGVKGTHVNTLKVAYRSSREVVRFAMGLLGPLREDELPVATRSGPTPELFRFTDHGACVAFLADALRDLLNSEPLASVVLLTRDSQMSALYYHGLNRAELPFLRRVTDQDFSFSPGVEVTEIAQVKGLEFDYVVLIEVSAAQYAESPTSRRLLHVGATRAVHQLWLTSVEEVSQIVSDALDA